MRLISGVPLQHLFSISPVLLQRVVIFSLGTTSFQVLPALYSIRRAEKRVMQALKQYGGESDLSVGWMSRSAQSKRPLAIGQERSKEMVDMICRVHPDFSYTVSGSHAWRRSCRRR